MESANITTSKEENKEIITNTQTTTKQIDDDTIIDTPQELNQESIEQTTEIKYPFFKKSFLEDPWEALLANSDDPQRKRSRNDGNNSGQTNRESNWRPPCKFGADCNIQLPEHKNSFYHPRPGQFRGRGRGRGRGGRGQWRGRGEH